MAIVLDGNLGITTPAETVQGALTTTGNTILGDASTDTLNVGNGGLVKDASGNVGIGVATPSYPLDVQNAVTTGVGTVIGAYNTASSGSSIATLRIRTAGTGAGYWDINTGNTSSGLNSGIRFFDNIASAERMRIDSSGNLLFNSGYGSAATAYGCRAWVNFNGTGTVAIRASGNVSSITDNAVGEYTVNFTTAMVDANYAYVGTCKDVAGGAATSMYPAGSQTTSSCSIQTVTISPIVEADKAFVWCAFFR